MGDPRKQRKKYKTPSHPWQKDRIDEEKKLLQEFGLVNKKELWKMETKLLNFKEQAKKLIRRTDEQARKEETLLMEKLGRLKLIPADSKIEKVLDLTLRDMLERRLQTAVLRKGFAKTPKQARQFIVHGHVIVRGKKLDVPSYLVPVDEEDTITFKATSALADNEHPERVIKKKAAESTLGKKTKEQEFEEILEKGPKVEEPKKAAKENKPAPKKEAPKEKKSEKKVEAPKESKVTEKPKEEPKTETKESKPAAKEETK